MGSWYLALFVSLLLVLVGLYLHWSVVLAGALLPVIPLVGMLRRQRQSRGPGGGPPGRRN